MDIHCKFCGEPWDHDELRTICRLPKVYRKTASHCHIKKRRHFFQDGCGAFQTNFGENNPTMCRASMVDAEAAAWATASHILSDEIV